MSLKYSKNAVIKGFTGIPDQFALYGQNNTFVGGTTKTVQEQINEINMIANDCRGWYKPIFSGESQFLPVNKPQDVSTIVAEIELKSAPEPPNKKEENVIVNALILGAGIFVLYKILS
jgi:hypothetical protein